MTAYRYENAANNCLALGIYCGMVASAFGWIPAVVFVAGAAGCGVLLAAAVFAWDGTKEGGGDE